MQLQFYKKLFTKMIIFVVCFSYCSMPSTVSANSTSSQIRQVLKKQKVNGIVLINGSVNKPHVISHQVTINGHKAKAIKANHLFPVASFQKAITGVAIQQLINDHRLSLNTKLSRYLPNVPNARQITIGNLLSHTSGLDDARRIAPYPIKNEHALIRFTETNGKAISKPGTWHYANVNYGLLAIIISKVSHESYSQYVKRHIFKPNGLKEMLFYNQMQSPESLTETLKMRKHMTRPTGIINWRYLQREMSAEFGAGQILSTPRAYWRFINKSILEQPRILAAYKNAQVWGNVPYYGGFYTRKHGLHTNGSYRGYVCTVFTDTKDKKTIILFSNNITLKQGRRLGYKLYQIYTGKSWN